MPIKSNINNNFQKETASIEYFNKNLIHFKFETPTQTNYSQIQSPEILNRYTFEFHKIQKGSLEEFIEHYYKKGYFLCKDGHIKKIEQQNIDCFTVFNREIAIKIKRELEQELDLKIQKENLTIPPLHKPLITIHITREGPPTHLFTKEEIKKQMDNADDRFSNILVVDENGFALIIPRTEYESFYPVRLETWNAYNNYVGKYSNLDNLNDCYICCLQGWLQYLEYGRTVFVDFLEPNTNEKELITKIQRYYKY